MRPINLSQIKSSRQLSVKHQWVQQLIDHNFQYDSAYMARDTNGFFNPHWPHQNHDPLLPQIIAQAYQTWWQQHIARTTHTTASPHNPTPDPLAYHRTERWRIHTVTQPLSAARKLNDMHLGDYLIQQPRHTCARTPATIPSKPNTDSIAVFSETHALL